MKKIIALVLAIMLGGAVAGACASGVTGLRAHKHNGPAQGGFTSGMRNSGTLTTENIQASGWGFVSDLGSTLLTVSGAANLNGGVTATNMTATNWITAQTGATLNALNVATSTALNSMNVVGTANFAGAVTSSRPCAAGFTRITPNYCDAGSSSFTGVASCTLVSALLPALPVTARAAVIEFNIEVNATNAVNNKRPGMMTYTDSACSVLHDNDSFTVREFVATTAGALIAVNYVKVLSAQSGNSWSVRVIDALATGGIVGSARVAGYFD